MTAVELRNLAAKLRTIYANPQDNIFIYRAADELEKLTQQAAVHPWLIKKEPHSKDKYYVAEGSPPDRVLEIYGIKPQGDKP